MASFKQMRSTGELTRADAEKIEYRLIHVDPQFNAEGRNEEQDENDEELYQFIIGGGFSLLPQLEVRPRDEGGVKIVDGHRRHKQIGRAIEAGLGHLFTDKKTGKILIRIRQFEGNDLDELYRVGTSNKSKDLSPLQFAGLVKRAHIGFNQPLKDVAKGFGVSITKVEQAMILALANNDVQQSVKGGMVSATEAVKVVRQHGSQAGKVIARAAAALPAGKTKVTAATLAKIAPAADAGPPRHANLVVAIGQEMASNGELRADEIAPMYAHLINYLRGTEK